VLITGIGRGTKELNKFANHVNKSYEAVVLFGVATDTYDCEGKVIGRKPYEHVTEALVLEKLAGFRGKGLQRPPIFSAIKQDGKPLYEYAREGKKPPREIEKREVDVLELELVEWMEGGRHEYKWPTEEATAEEKKFAEMLSEVDNVATLKEEEAQSIVVKEELKDEDTTNIKTEDNQPATSHSKGKPEDQDTNSSTTKNDPPAKDKPTTTPPPSTHMSGALPNDPPTTDPTSTNPATSTTLSPSSIPLPPAARIRMTVTSGFYVRSLCSALGASVNSCALMSSLIRTRQGEFELGKNVVEYEDFEKGEEVWGPKVEAALVASQGPAEGGGKRGRDEDGKEGHGREGKRQETRMRQRNSSSELSD